VNINLLLLKDLPLFFIFFYKRKFDHFFPGLNCDYFVVEFATGVAYGLTPVELGATFYC